MQKAKCKNDKRSFYRLALGYILVFFRLHEVTGPDQEIVWFKTAHETTIYNFYTSVFLRVFETLYILGFRDVKNRFCDCKQSQDRDI